MAELSVHRKSEWNNRVRDFGVYIDDEKVGVIANGETKIFPVEVGTHNVKAKIDWCRSQDFKIILSENEPSKIEMSGFKYGNIVPYVSMVIIAIYFLVKYFFNVNLTFIIYIIIPLFSYTIYFITFGHNRYIEIKQLH